MGGVEVLDDGHLEAGGAALAGGDGGPGEEELPDLGQLAMGHTERLTKGNLPCTSAGRTSP